MKSFNWESYVGIAGLIIGLFGLISGFFFYRLSRIGRRFAYKRSGLRLLGGESGTLPTEVAVTYKGQVVENLTVTNVLIWNNGRETIRGVDVVDSNPLRLEVTEGCEILDVQELLPTRKEISFRADVDPKKPNQRLLRFEYLDPNDGARIRILHTDTKKLCDVEGTIQGIPGGLKDLGKFVDFDQHITLKKVVLWGAIVFFAITLFTLFEPFVVATLYSAFPFLPSVVGWFGTMEQAVSVGSVNYLEVVLSSAFTIALFWLWWKLRAAYPSDLVERFKEIQKE